MIKLLIEQPGFGKTKEMIEQVNQEVTSAKGHIIFIAESNETMLEINHDVRYINISEFPLDSSNEIVAFLHGLMGSDYDIESIYLDGLLNIYIMTPEEICDWLDKIKVISDKHNVMFRISISIDGEIADCLKQYQ